MKRKHFINIIYKIKIFIIQTHIFLYFFLFVFLDSLMISFISSYKYISINLYIVVIYTYIEKFSIYMMIYTYCII